MLYKVKLKNAAEEVLLDDMVYEYLSTDPYLKEIDFINNLRKHSSGCAFFQKTWKMANGKFKNETFYLHKLIAERYLKASKTGEKQLVGTHNGNKLDCRVDNLVYRSRATASRLRHTASKEGYTGVYRENKRFRAVISINKKTIHIGMYDTPEEAALAYNKRSVELFGQDGKLNKIKSSIRNK